MKLLNLLLIALVYIPLNSWAGAYEKYTQLSNLLQTQLKTQSQATLNLFFENGLNCSGVLVDPQGRALTNLHCIEGCLMAKGAFSQELAYSEPVFVDPQNSNNKQFIQKIKPDLSDDISCAVKIGIGGKKRRALKLRFFMFLALDLYILGLSFHI
jgi:hypothetical protein